MLNLLVRDDKIRKLKIEKEEILSQRVQVIKIPCLKKRYLKKAGKILGGSRVIIPENWDGGRLKLFGIVPIDTNRIFKYIVAEIYNKTVEKFNLRKEKICTLICGGRLSSPGIDKIIKNARYVLLRAANSEEISRLLLEEYGVSIAERGSPDIIINMYEKDFSVYFIKGEQKFELSEVCLAPISGGEWLPQIYLKGVYLAFLEAGLMSADDIIVEEIAFDMQKLT